jgi:hypothetical protein
MIVYYNSDTGDVVGMSMVMDTSRTDPYIETDDIVAENIFFKKDKLAKYRLVVTSRIDKTGFFQLKATVQAKSLTIDEKIYLIGQKNKDAEVILTQDKLSKIITVSIKPESYSWWIHNNDKKIFIAACLGNDPFNVSWTVSISQLEFNDYSMTVNYIGPDNLSFYTTKIFNEYYYEIKSS